MLFWVREDNSVAYLEKEFDGRFCLRLRQGVEFPVSVWVGFSAEGSFFCPDPISEFYTKRGEAFSRWSSMQIREAFGKHHSQNWDPVVVSYSGCAYYSRFHFLSTIPI